MKCAHLSYGALLFLASACGDDSQGTGTGGSSSTGEPTGSTGVEGTSTGVAGSTGSSSTSGEEGSSSTTGSPEGPLHVQVLAINDFHGHLEPPPLGSLSEVQTARGFITTGGMAYLAADVDALRSEAPHTVVVSAGDLFGGSPLTSALLHDEPTIEAMDLLGLDIATVGNHEFDDGVDELLRMKEGGCHPVDGCVAYDRFDGSDADFLAANVTYEASGETLFPAVAIREFEGVSVAFIGVTLEGTPTIVQASATAALAFHDEVETVTALVPELQRQGVESIVVLLHLGGSQSGYYDECVDLAGPVVAVVEALPSAVDVVVSGHSHAAYNCEVAGKTVTSAAAYGKMLTDIDLEIDRESGDVLSVQATNRLVERDDVDPDMAALVEDAVAIVAPVANATVGSVTEDLLRTVGVNGQSPLGGVIADAQLASVSAPEDGGAQIALMNNGGIRADIIFAASGGEAMDGVVTYGELASVHPFGNSVTTMTLTGQQLHDILEEQFTVPTAPKVFEVSTGFTYSFSQSAPDGDRIDPASMVLDGTPIDPADEVRVAINDFVAGGGQGFVGFMAGTDVLGGPVDVEALATYFAASSPVAPVTEERVTVLP